MPPWTEFKDLCIQHFGPPICSNCLGALARLPVHTTVQDYQERFLALLCHAEHSLPSQKAELFTAGLPEHIKVEVELREPQDLQTAMRLARAYECRGRATVATAPLDSTRPPRPSIWAPTPVAVKTPTTTTTIPAPTVATKAIPMAYANRVGGSPEARPMLQLR